MHIKNIVIDGFKSYAQRTEVKDFDQYFNAITGLNGSGKSNILDSICFLLGITNLSQVRASSLQDLVYKNGQVGITKATVSITFDNRDKDRSPLGMESHNEITITRQIVIGGKNKYLINGVNAQNTRVADLFRTVGLNVNNPHFLIMQGRVTKVMNMKPPEILSMIEEATGTSMYEQKKIAAQKMISKKESKLNQINQTLEEELYPTLEKLREERSVFMQYQKTQREVERCKKLLFAYKFTVASKNAGSGEERLQKLSDQKTENRNLVLELDEKVKELTQAIQQQEQLCKEESGEKLDSMLKHLSHLHRGEAKAASMLKNQQEQLLSDKRDLKLVQESSKECNVILEKKRNILNEKKEECEKAEEESKNQEQEHTNAQKKYQAISAGLAIADNGEEASWKEQLLNATNRIGELNSNIKQTRLKLKHTNSELKRKQAELMKTDKSSSQEKRQLQHAEERLQNLKRSLEQLGYRENEYEELYTRKRELLSTIDNMSNQIQRLYRQIPQLAFNYNDPEPNWDRERVKGLVVELFQVSDSKYATALEITAGGRLFNVVVDNEQTSSLLINRGNLKRRCTMIPLSKISAHTISNQVVSKAKQLVGHDNVDLALNLLEFEQEVGPAMKYVFGGVLVCNNMTIATKVAFDRGIRCKTVTLDGQVVDPGGSLTGGNMRSQPILAAIAQSKDIRGLLKQSEVELPMLEQNIYQTKRKRDEFTELRNQISLVEQEVYNLKARLANTSQAILEQEIQQLETDKEQQRELLLRTEQELKEVTEKSEELKRKIDDAPAERERELKKAEADLKKSKKKFEKTREIFSDCKEALTILTLEIAALENEQTGGSEKVDRAKQVIVESEKKIEELEENLRLEQEKVVDCDKELQEQRRRVEVATNELQNQMKTRKENERKVAGVKEKLNEVDDQINRVINENQEAKQIVQTLLNDCEWIEAEKENFGQPGTIYDFKENPPSEVSKRYGKLKSEMEKMEKTVNVRAMTRLDNCEEKCSELSKKKRIVESDKSQIEKTIEELDRKKNAAVTNAYNNVNKNFGSIFSTLLPGATAKLSPMEGCSVLAGLEFRVGFGDVWKNNLNELSGGQRSLVALSLILALLLLKPAPIYILDEVDAALDLSHTQNIGRMLRDHFKKSQFIIVSLKDGMYDNANVVFRTKFVDGVSTVSRGGK